MTIYIPSGWLIVGLLLTWFALSFWMMDKRNLGPADTYADTQMSFGGGAILTLILWFSVAWLVRLCGIDITFT